jgi:hypothetical protein
MERMTIGWNKLKKFFMADMSQNRNTNASFSLLATGLPRVPIAVHSA